MIISFHWTHPEVHFTERKGRNPQTCEEIIIAAARLPSFKAGKYLKDAVNA